jgi:hypothetical protein
LQKIAPPISAAARPASEALPIKSKKNAADIRAGRFITPSLPRAADYLMQVPPRSAYFS